MERSRTDVTLCVLERPHDAINDQLLVLWGYLEEGAEAMCVDRLQEAEELQPVFREILPSREKNKQDKTWSASWEKKKR